MKRTTPKKIKKAIDLSNYVNAETGQVMSDEIGSQTRITSIHDTGQFIVKSNEFVVFDSAAADYLVRELTGAERARVFDMYNMVKGDCVVVMSKNNHPHTPDTLSAVLSMSLNKFYEFVRKLVKKNIMAYTVCAPSGVVQKIYMLNPYIGRKAKSVNNELLRIFRDVTLDKK